MSETWETDNRWRRMRISSALLAEIFRGNGQVPSSTTAPADLAFIGLTYVQGGPDGWYEFVVWSETFEPLPMTDGQLNDEMPLVKFEYRREEQSQ